MLGKIKILADELTNDPGSMGYSSMADNKEIVDALNDENISMNKTTVSNKEIFEAMDAVEFSTITGDNLVKVMGILALDSIDPFGIAADIFTEAFPGNGPTLAALGVLRKYNISRAKKLGLPAVKEGWIEQAKGNTDSSIKEDGPLPEQAILAAAVAAVGE